ncbi:UNVERIFIED_CONTAM: hypothetical protein HDU68_009799, partial [Siphonaria sp. JEL0065]
MNQNTEATLLLYSLSQTTAIFKADQSDANPLLAAIVGILDHKLRPPRDLLSLSLAPDAAWPFISETLLKYAIEADNSADSNVSDGLRAQDVRLLIETAENVAGPLKRGIVFTWLKLVLMNQNLHLWLK